MSRKPPVSPSLTTKVPSESVKTGDNPLKIFGHEKAPETLIFRGFLHVRWSRSALAELRNRLNKGFSDTFAPHLFLTYFYAQQPRAVQDRWGVLLLLLFCAVLFQFRDIFLNDFPKSLCIY